MKIEIDQIVDHGTLNSEKVLMSVIESDELQYYIVADTSYLEDGTISNKLRHMYWFKPKSVNVGDKIELYTKAGTNGQIDLGNGNIKYVIYWGLGNPIWNNDGDGAILFHVDSWKTTKTKGAR